MTPFQVFRVASRALGLMLFALPAGAVVPGDPAGGFWLGLDGSLLTIAAAALIMGGIVKGAIGVGLPIVTIAILSNFLPVPLVLALVTVPILLTNLWQAVRSGNLMEPLRRFWPMVVCLLVVLWFSAKLVVTLDPRVLFVLLGSVVGLFAISSHFRVTWTVPPEAEKWAAPLAGTIGGFLGGISTIWGPPMMMYFIMLKLPKEAYIRAVGLVWFAGSLPLVVAYVSHGILTADNAPLSAIACIPSFVGMAVGQWLRGKVNQETFRKGLLLFLFVIGVNLIRRGLF